MKAGSVTGAALAAAALTLALGTAQAQAVGGPQFPGYPNYGQPIIVTPGAGYSDGFGVPFGFNLGMGGVPMGNSLGGFPMGVPLGVPLGSNAGVYSTPFAFVGPYGNIYGGTANVNGAIVQGFAGPGVAGVGPQGEVYNYPGYGYAYPGYYGYPGYDNGANPVEQNSLIDEGTVQLQPISAHRIRVLYNGDTRDLASINISLLDANKKTLRQTSITDNSTASMTLFRPVTAVYYRAEMVYQDGATRTMTAHL